VILGELRKFSCLFRADSPRDLNKLSDKNLGLENSVHIPLGTNPNFQSENSTLKSTLLDPVGFWESNLMEIEIESSLR